MKEQKGIVRTEPRSDVFPVLTVLERHVRIEKTRPGGRSIRVLTKFSVRTVEEWLASIRSIRQRHRPIDERDSGLGVRFDPENPRFIFITQRLGRQYLSGNIRQWYSYDIVRNVRKNPDGSVDTKDMKRRRSEARLRAVKPRAKYIRINIWSARCPWDETSLIKLLAGFAGTSGSATLYRRVGQPTKFWLPGRGLSCGCMEQKVHDVTGDGAKVTSAVVWSSRDPEEAFGSVLVHSQPTSG